MSLACQPIFRYGGATVMPGVSAGTRNVERPCVPPPGSVAAATTCRPLISVPQFVMNAFVPSITQCAAVEPSRWSGPPRRRCPRPAR